MLVGGNPSRNKDSTGLLAERCTIIATNRRNDTLQFGDWPAQHPSELELEKELDCYWITSLMHSSSLELIRGAHLLQQPSPLATNGVTWKPEPRNTVSALTQSLLNSQQHRTTPSSLSHANIAGCATQLSTSPSCSQSSFDLLTVAGNYPHKSDAPASAASNEPLWNSSCSAMIFGCIGGSI